MKYKITHTTRYEYQDVVPLCRNTLYLTPRNTPYQTCSRHRLTIKPHPTSWNRRRDYFGNTVATATIDKPHRQLQITASSAVELRERLAPQQSPCWEDVRDGLARNRTPVGLDIYQFAFPSPHVPREAELLAYAAESFAAQRPIFAAASELNRRVFDDFAYDPEATTVSTPIAEAFRQRRGVCQDLAHVMLGCLRALGLAARYVSGYLRTIPPAGQPRLIGADESHAWISVYCGAAGWVDLDPTNNLLPGTDHITVAWGRDYSDVCPVAGMFVGGGNHQLSVSVDVAERG